MTVIASEITKIYPDRTEALRGVSLELDGGVLGMIGPNGAGKTTLLRILATLLAPSSGRLSLFGNERLDGFQAIRHMIGYIPQDIRLVEDLSVRENLEYFFDLRRVPASSRQRWIDEHLDLIGMTQQSGTRAGRLSGGERRKVGFAIGILHRPRLVICDEITTGLDPGERVFFRNLLAEIGARTCVIFSTHILEDISAAADQLCVLAGGRNAFTGRPRDLTQEKSKVVWCVDATLEDANAVERKFLVTERQVVGERVRLKVITARPPPGAVQAPCRLEDAFLSLLPEEKRTEFAELRAGSS